MKCNVGGADRVIRIILGVLIFLLFFILDGGAKYIGLIGIVLILTGLFRFCPLYIPFNINTGDKK